MGGQGAKAGSIAYDEVVSPTIRSALSGTNTTPDVAIAIDQQGGKGTANNAKDVMLTLCSDSHGTPHAVCYGIGSYASNAMKSDNPHSGIYEAKTSRTLDLNGGNPACNQGGVVVAIDCRNMAANNEVSATIQSKNQGGHRLNYINPIIYESEEDKC